MPDSEKKLFLLDAMALIYRAYFALNKNPRINSKGLNTSAVLGFANTLLELLKNERPTHIGVVFDSHGPTLRHDAFSAYKANREDMPEDIATSLPYIRQLIEGFDIPVLAFPGYEADDIIGTLAREAEMQGFITYMVTPDKDFGQLVTDKTFIYKPARAGEGAQILGVKEVCQRYGIEHPKQLIDILGLWGDASDNIPGIPGIGEKRSQELIARYGSVEGLIENAEELSGKLKENVLAFADQGRQSKSLATIITDVPLPFDPSSLKMSAPDEDKLRLLFDELEFRTFSKRVAEYLRPGNNAPQPPSGPQDLFSSAGVANPSSLRNLQNTPHRYHLTETAEQQEKLASLLAKQAEFCFDTETSSLNTLEAALVGISFAIKKGEAWYLPLPKDREECLRILSQFKPVFENQDIVKTGHNLKYDIGILRNYDIEVAGKLQDTMIAHYLLEPDLRHNMDYLAEHYLQYSPVPIESLIGKKGPKQGNMRDLEARQISDYACEDADITLQLWASFEPELRATGTRKVFDEIEMPLVKVLSSMERTGVQLDTDALKEISSGLEKEILKIEAEIYTLSGMRFNIASPKQLGEVLFDHLKISEKAKKTKSGQYSTGEDVLSKLAHLHPVIDKVLEFRQLSKLKSTYVDALPSLISPITGRIHTSYNQAVAATGRLSSTQPNLQNIPVRTAKGREIRKAFVPRDEDHILLAADYSQIELRLIAHLSRDEAMMQAFMQGEDIHTATASRVFGIAPEQVNREMRSKAKEVNFGLIYGMSAFGLAERLRIPRKEAAEIMEAYFRQYPGVKEYMAAQMRFAKEKGYVETIYGRRRYLRDIRSSNAMVRAMAERNAINAPIQGSSADMIKLAMIRIQQEIDQRKLKSRMIMQVHDELVFDALKEELEILKPLVEQNMREALPLDVPLLVDMNTGENWLEAH